MKYYLSTLFLLLSMPCLASLCVSNEDLMNDKKFRTLLKNPCVKDWVKEESQSTLKFLESPLNTQLEQRLSLYKATNSFPPIHIESGELLLRAGSLVYIPKGESEVILISKASLPTGTVVKEFIVSPDSQKILFSLVSNGSDVAEWSFYDLKNRRPFPDAPLRVRLLTINWDSTSEGAFYSQWPSAQVEADWLENDSPRRVPVAYHRIGATEPDEVIFEDPEKRPSMVYGVEEVTPGKQLLAYRHFPQKVTPMSLYWGEKKETGYVWKPIQLASEKPLVRARFLGRYKNEAFFWSSECGNNYCVIAMDLKGKFKRRVVVSEHKNRIISSAQMFGDKIYIQYFDQEFKVSLSVYSPESKLLLDFLPSQLNWPERGTMSLIMGSQKSSKLAFTYAAMDFAPSTAVIDITNMSVVSLPNSEPAPAMLKNVKTEVRFYPSLDGTMIPIHVYTRADLKTKPKFALLYYYGAITISSLSDFSPRFLMVLEMGGMVAVANIRGGGDRGEDWFRAGALDKSKTISDIAAASRWLKQTYPIEGKKVIAQGGSWGGVHTYMTLNKYAADFTAFIALVPLGNVPYGFKYSPIGWILPDDLLLPRAKDGNYVNYNKSLEKIRKWSPLQNVKSMKEIKPILTIGAADDQRTGSEQTYFIPMALRNKFGDKAPNYLLELDKGGHAARSLIQELAFMGIQSNVTVLPDPLK